MFCFHKFSEVKNRYQYCIKCGFAIAHKCQHTWKIIETKNVCEVGYTVPMGTRSTLQCEQCGDLKVFNSWESKY